MKLANIVSSISIKVSEDFNVVKTIDKIIYGLPTLIVGYDLVDKLYPNFDITNMDLGNNMYWTFKRTEKRDQYEEDLAKFTIKVYKNLLNDVSYVFIDPIQQKYKTLIKIIRKIASLKEVISYQDGQMIYIYGENLIFGVDLKLIHYIGIDSTKIKSKIIAISTVFLRKNEILIEYKKNVELLDNKVMYIPFLYSIRNGENNLTSLIYR